MYANVKHHKEMREINIQILYYFELWFLFNLLALLQLQKN